MRTIRTLWPALLVAVFLAGCEQIAQIVSPKIEDISPPGDVFNLVAEPGDKVVVLTWLDPPDNDLKQVQVVANGATLIVGAGVQTQTITGLKNGVKIPVAVRTMDKEGNKSRGISLDVTPQEPKPIEFTVTFDTKGGSDVPPLKNLAKGTVISAPEPPPTKPASTFAGWFKDSTYTTPWDFSTEVTEDVTLFARWGSAALVGAWFDIQDANLKDAYSDDAETILFFQISGVYQKYQRTHQAGDRWPTIDENQFFFVEEGSYYYDQPNAKLNTTPQGVNIAAVGLLAGAESAPGGLGLKNRSEAEKMLAGQVWAQRIPGWYEKTSRPVSLGSSNFMNWDADPVTSLTITVGQGNEVYHLTTLATVESESGDDFRVPNTPKDFPEPIRTFLPKPELAPTKPSVYAVQTVLDKLLASVFVTVGLADAGNAVSDSSNGYANDGETDYWDSGTTSGVNWYYETILTPGDDPADTNYDSWATYTLAANENLGNGVTLLANSYLDNETIGVHWGVLDTSEDLSNVSTYYVDFSGSSVTSISVEWDDVNEVLGPDLLVNGDLHFTYTAP